MPLKNEVSINIPPEVFAKCEAAIEVLKTELKPYLIALTPKERRAIPKMSDKSYTFVQKIVAYTESNPEFSPAYLDVAELVTDFNAVSKLNALFRPIKSVSSLLDDTIKLSGGEAYRSSLAYYNSVKIAEGMDIPNAKPIYSSLRERFPQRGLQKKINEADKAPKE